MFVVLDTNVLVSAILSPGRNAADILEAVFAHRFTACYDWRIAEEYERVLRYRKFSFSERDIRNILDPILKEGISVIAPPIRTVSFEQDENGRKFYEVMKFTDAVLITGNLKHFPNDPMIMSPADFCVRYL